MALTREDALAKLLARLPRAEAAVFPVKDYPTVRLASADDVRPGALFLKDGLGFDYLEMVTAVDWLGPVKLDGFIPSRNPNPFSEKAPDPAVIPAPGAGVSYRPVLDMLWSFGNLKEGLKMFLRLEVPRDNPEVPSLTDIFPAADWQEREAFDLLGVRFMGHPNLAKILTPDFLVGHPLRKDYVHQKDRYDD
jgi:NADH:ubiquinone oxidoreductase subunit C